ncbi:MAG: alanine--tRNA ligase [Lachnospiraceae bacterium]|nr:alanine--tRNA ligase [Lachnospiraceae bacterium]
MKPYGVNELREMFLQFFESKDHLRLRSFSLVPHNDNSLLLINSGMAPMKSYFTGKETPPRKRVVTCQKCIRTGDIENVGKTTRHLTFFEMLGNFSFGDYFKKEAIAWSWEFLTETLQIDPNRLYPSIYCEDEEAFAIWNQDIGIPADKITRFYRDEDGECDNFWEHGAGPCGPCSEIYYDRGEAYGCGDPQCKVGCDCDRYVEIWNNVFTQFESDGKHHYQDLNQKNIDTGMGLERLAMVVQDVNSVYDIDTMKGIREKVCELTNHEYGIHEASTTSIRLITDHIRSATFMISDGIHPINEGRGYVLRRLIRRAARHGRLLGVTEPGFLSRLCRVVIAQSGAAYPELEEKEAFIVKVLSQEESRFEKTIDQGLLILGELTKDLRTSGQTQLSGEQVFKLYDTYGFPTDLTEEILSETGYTYDRVGFDACMQIQKDTARKARKVTNYMGADITVYESLDPTITTTFVGYDLMKHCSTVMALTTEDEVVQALTDGEKGTIIVSETPFYATSGGQQADHGIITTKDGIFEVSDVIRLLGGKIAHVGAVSRGMIKVGDKASLTVDVPHRNMTCRNHSATHLLQKALREVLGSHVHQAGSSVDHERLRFDFHHFAPLSKEELFNVERRVQDKIEEALNVVTKVMRAEDAKKIGAMALFDEKYGETVRVVSMGEYSLEFCGGTHVSNTATIGNFKIVSEAGIAAGVRRIEALTGKGVLEYYRMVQDVMDSTQAILKVPMNLVPDKCRSLLAELKATTLQVEAFKSKAANDEFNEKDLSITMVKGVKLLTAQAKGLDGNTLREQADRLKDKIGEGVVVLFSEYEGKVNMVAMATQETLQKGVHAGNLLRVIAPMVGGGGGGRPNMAQAGGKDPSGISKAIANLSDVLGDQITTK